MKISREQIDNAHEQIKNAPEKHSKSNTTEKRYNPPFASPENYSAEPINIDITSAADSFQTVLYNSGINLLKNVKPVIIEDSSESVHTSFGKAAQALENLKNFEYNIGFGGEQSCGKSALINALIQYPLMASCNLNTTCAVVQLRYGKNIRITAYDDKNKKALDIDCSKISKAQLDMLKTYVCAVMPVMLIENIRYFTDKISSINKGEKIQLSQSDLDDMKITDPKHVALLLLILLSVYVGQDEKEVNDDKQKAIKLRSEIYKYFGLDANKNYFVTVYWENDLLKKGLVITDLPGLGSTDSEHDRVAMGAKTDAVAFLATPELRDAGTPILDNMLSDEDLKGTVSKSNRIIPILNKVDLVESDHLSSTIDKFLDVFNGHSIKMSDKDIRLCSSMYGEYCYKEIPLERKQFFKKKYKEIYEDYLDDGESVEEAKIKATNRVLKKFETGYNKSGIKELEDFFHAVFIEKGKYSKSVEALSKINDLYLNSAKRMSQIEKNISAAKNVNSEILNSINGNFRTNADKICSDNINSMDSVIDKVNETLNNDESIKSIPDKFNSSFNEALEEYRKKLLNIINDFDCDSFFHMFSARIDKVPSKNHDLYSKLKSESEKMQISNKSVNEAFKKIFVNVMSEIENVFKTEEKLLEESNKSILIELKHIEESYKNDPEFEPVKMLIESVGNCVDNQTDIAQSKMKDISSDIDNKGIKLVDKIIDFTHERCNDYAKAIQNKIQDCLHTAWLSSKEYITITGDKGIKTKVENLKLSDDDKNSIKASIIKVCAQTQMDISNWIKDTDDSISELNTSYREKVKELINETKNLLSQNDDEKSAEVDRLRKRIDLLNNEFNFYRKKVQPEIDLAAENSGDSDLQKFSNNLLN